MKGLEHADLKLKMIYNLFSNFGNIQKVIFIKPRGCALIEYQNEGYATIAKDFLNNLMFFNNYLRVSLYFQYNSAAK